MRFLQKRLPFIASVVLVFLLAILAVEAAHHHDDTLEGHDNCSICAWQVTGSQAVATPAPPVLFQAMLLVFVFSFTPFYVSRIFSSPSGRSPPQNLL